MKFIIRPLLSILSIPLLSRLYGKIQRLKRPKWLVRRVIPFFARHYKIDMDQYIGEFSDYSSLNEFFVRRIDPEKRPLKDIYDDTALVSPADGFLVGIDTVHEDATTQAKGRDYKLSTFVQENLPFKDGWHVATIYLSPQNYHRYHHTLSAEITGYCHKGGSLFPVNEWGVGLVKNLFNRNERVITKYRKNDQDLYVVAVGATFVGSIHMEFIDRIKRDGQWKKINVPVKQLDEMGRFEMGSTIIMVIPTALADPAKGISNQKIRLGDPIFRLKS